MTDRPEDLPDIDNVSDPQELKRIGRMYMLGWGVTQSHTEATRWYMKAAELGDSDAQWILGHVYENGQGVPQSFEEAVSWYRKAADQGNPDAQWLLGLCYELGRGVDQSYTEAARLYREGADNAAYSMYYLGRLYLLGRGVERSEEEGIKLLKMAAEGGCGEACNLLGQMCLRGNNILQASVTDAFRWFLKGAGDLRNLDCEFNLGVLYEQERDFRQIFDEELHRYIMETPSCDEYRKGVINRLTGTENDFPDVSRWDGRIVD